MSTSDDSSIFSTTANALVNFSGLSSKEKRIVVCVAAGGAAWFGCCLAAYLSWRNYGRRHDSFSSVSPVLFLGPKSQKSQFVINELRKVTEEVTALRQDVNGVKILVKQLRRDIAELRCLDRNGAVTMTVGNLLHPASSLEFHPVESGAFGGELDGGYNEDDESELEFRSAKSEILDVASRGRSPVKIAVNNYHQQQRPLTSTPSIELLNGRDRLGSLSLPTFANNDNRKRSTSESVGPLLFAEIDAQLNGNDKALKRKTLRRLELLHTRHRNNPEIMWRLGRALFYESEWLKVNEPNNTNQRRETTYRAKDMCFEALSLLSEPTAAVYKWCALTLGSLQPYETISNRIKQGYEFRELVEKSIELDPNDPMCHYLLGRWFFGCYQLTWYERKIAATLFATPPSATIDEALGAFLKCSELLTASSQPDWKENCLYIAKCYIEKRDTSGEATRWLKAGEFLPDTNEESHSAGLEIVKLLAQYSY